MINVKVLNLQSLNYEKYIAFDCENRNEQSRCSDINLNCEYYTSKKFNDQANFKHGLSIIHLNCRSLKANFNQIKDYLKDLHVKIDVITMSETWLNESEIEYVHFNGYEGVHTCRSERKGGGVSIYINFQRDSHFLSKKNIYLNVYQ